MICEHSVGSQDYRLYTFTVASRFIFRRPISYVAILLVTFVVIMYMVVISVLEGFKNHYMDKIQSIMSHVTVDVGKLAWSIEKPATWSAEIAKADPDIRGVTVGLETPAMALLKDARTIGTLSGIDLDTELKYGRLGEILEPPEFRAKMLKAPDFGTPPD